MFTPDQYQLIDFGRGRRLESFGPWRFDRPCPAAKRIARADPDAWPQADARFDRTEGEEGQWSLRRELPEQWTIVHGPLTFELKRTPAGHLGVFPEQAANWDWITDQLRKRGLSLLGEGTVPFSAAPPKVLNLFAYTGGSTLAAASAGAEVVHVDAAQNTTAWARRNAELSGMTQKPIRWIADDAVKFLERELRRGNRYDAVILDPPSYGHGPQGQLWRLTKHLPRLLEMCGQLTAGQRRLMLLTCHTPGFDPARLRCMMTDALGETDDGTMTARQLTIRSATGRDLPSGMIARWQPNV